EFTCFEGRARARRGHFSRSLNDRLRESIAVSEVFVRVIERRNCLKIQCRQEFDSLASFYMSFVFQLAALPRWDVAGKQDGNGVQVGTFEATDPLIRMIRAGESQDVRSGSHPLTKLFRKSS